MATGLARVLSPAALRTVAPLLEPGVARGPVAFDADGTLWRGDVGEDLLRWLAAEGLLPAGPSRGIYAEYERRVAIDAAAGYAFAVELMAGLAEAALEGLCREFFARRFEGRLFPFTRPLLDELAAAGHEIWIVSASPVWIVAVGVEGLGVGLDRVIAVKAEIAAGQLTRRVEQPIPFGPGKVQQLESRGVRPALAVGNGEGDLPMLEYAGSALVVAPYGDDGNGLVRAANARGWAVQRG